MNSMEKNSLIPQICGIENSATTSGSRNPPGLVFLLNKKVYVIEPCKLKITRKGK